MIFLRIGRYLAKMRDNYLISRVAKVEIPEFNEGEIFRKSLIFSGKVQNVGFRLETHQMGKRLGLKGWVKNKEDGTVEAEAQGEEEKIKFLIDHLKSLRRASVENIVMKDIEVKRDEQEFKAIL